MYKFDQEKFWAGTSASFYAVIDAQERAIEYLSSAEARGKADVKAWVDEMVGPVYTPEGSVGVINIKGSLINGEAGFMRLYGALGYDDIREALTEAVADKNVKTIMLKIDSGGGQVAGVQELGDYIREVSKVKAVSAFSDTIMASAAYWLGCSADKVMSGKTTTVGSIGVLIVHQEVSKMMADAGVTTTIVRSGKYKALVNRYEPLSELAKEELQSQVDDLDNTFISYVADQRGVSVDAARRKMGQGREFLGARALDAGLVDSITTFSDAHAVLNGSTASKAPNARKPVASHSASANNPPNAQQGSPMKVNLTPEQLAALAAGAAVASLGLSAEEQAAVEAAMNASTAETPEEPEQPAATEQPAAAQPNTQPAANTSVVDFLRAELKDANTTLAATTAELTTAKAQIESNKTERAALLQIARAHIGNMQVALGGTNTADALADADVLAEHTRMTESFAKKFKVGRVTAAPKSEEQPQAATLSPTLLAVLAQAQKQSIK